jgi:hypothetical protein
MWNRSECERGATKESAEATDRRILLIQMLLAFKNTGDIDAFPNGDGSDVLYQSQRPRGAISILVEAPDQGAVHVFERPEGISDSEHRERIFALFRPFNSLVTRMITRSDGSQAYARVGDVDELPEDFVMAEILPDETAENKKMRKNNAVFDAHPEMKAALTVLPKSGRLSLQEFLGWQTIVTHRKQELTKAVFEDALGMPLRRAKAVEGQKINEITASRKTHGEGGADEAGFHGGSWHGMSPQKKRN